MAKQQSARPKGRTLDEIQGDATIQDGTGIDSGDGQNIPVETGQDEPSSADPLKEFVRYKAKLRIPKANTWEAYRNALDMFERDLIVVERGEESEHGVMGGNYAQIRIIRATVPITATQPFHMGTFSGYGVEKGDEFTVRLSTGKYVRGE